MEHDQSKGGEDNTEEHETIEPSRPRIYAASLADYNAGRLHGVWINANQDAEQLSEEIAAMLRRSPTPGAEEWAIHDYESFGPAAVSEYDSLERISRITRGIAEHGQAFAAWAAIFTGASIFCLSSG